MKWGARLLVIITLAILWLPAIALVLSGMAGDPIRFQFSSVRLSHLFSSAIAPDVASSLLRTLWLGLSVGIATSSLALVIVWLGRGRDIESRWCSLVLLIPLLAPPLAVAIAIGDMQRWCGLSPGLSSVIVALSTVFIPVAIFLNQIRANRLKEHFLLCARNLGASPRKVFFSVFLRHQKIAVVSAIAVGMALAMGEPIISQHLSGKEPPFAALVMSKLSASIDGRLIANAAVVFLATVALLLIGASLTWLGTRRRDRSES